MHEEELVAALGDASGREITARLPCQMRFGSPAIEFGEQDVLDVGIADTMLIFCADCGNLVTMHRMNVLLVFEPGRVSRYGTGGILFTPRPQPRGLA